MKNKKILLLWYQEGDNFGDVLLYQTTKEYLEAARYDIESHEVGDFETAIAEHANQCGFLIFAGGGIIEKYVPTVIQKIEEFEALLQVPYGVIGIGIGDFDYREYSDAFRKWVNQAAFFYVRDKETQAYLNALIGGEKVRFSGDVVFANETVVRDKNTGNGIGLNMRDIPYADIQGEFDWTVINEMIDKAGCNILIPDCNNQMAYLNTKFENMADMERYESLNREEKVSEVIAAIKKCHILVAMRFHVVLVAAIMNVIPIPVLYCPKVRYLAKQLGIMDLAIELGEWEKIPGKVELARNGKDRYLENIKGNIAVFRKNVLAMYGDVRGILEGGIGE